MNQRTTALAAPQELSGRARQALASKTPSPNLHRGNLHLSLDDSARRRLLRSPTDPRSWGAFGRASAAPAERRCKRPQHAIHAEIARAGRCAQTFAGEHAMDIDAASHRRRVSEPSAGKFRDIRRHDRHNDMKITRAQSEGDLHGRAFFDHAVHADRYAELLGRPVVGEALETVDEEPGLEASVDEVPLPTLLQSQRRHSPNEPDSPKDYLPPKLSVGIWRDPALQDTLKEVATESAHFGKLLKEAEQALVLERFAGALASETAAAKAKQLNEKLDALEAKTASLQQQAKRSLTRKPSSESMQSALSEKAKKVQEAECRRKGFNLVGKGQGWYVAPALSQV